MRTLLDVMTAAASYPVRVVSRFMDAADDVWDLDDPLLSGDDLLLP